MSGVLINSERWPEETRGLSDGAFRFLTAALVLAADDGGFVPHYVDPVPETADLVAAGWFVPQPGGGYLIRGEGDLWRKPPEEWPEQPDVDPFGGPA